MNEVEVEILGIEGRERLVKSWLDVLGGMEVVPQLYTMSGGQHEMVRRAGYVPWR